MVGPLPQEHIGSTRVNTLPSDRKRMPGTKHTFNKCLLNECKNFCPLTQLLGCQTIPVFHLFLTRSLIMCHFIGWQCHSIYTVWWWGLSASFQHETMWANLNPFGYHRCQSSAQVQDLRRITPQKDAFHSCQRARSPITCPGLPAEVHTVLSLVKICKISININLNQRATVGFFVVVVFFPPKEPRQQTF